jgi:hypothetical protein
VLRPVRLASLSSRCTKSWRIMSVAPSMLTPMPYGLGGVTSGVPSCGCPAPALVLSFAAAELDDPYP